MRDSNPPRLVLQKSPSVQHMNAILSIIVGNFASLTFATILGYTQLYKYLTNLQLLCIGWTISASTAIITYQTLH